MLEVGDYSLLHGTIVQNLPVNEQLALRGAFDYIEHDGYQPTGADSKEDYAARLSALYQPTDALDIYVWLHGAKKDGDSPNLVRRGYNDGNFNGNPNAFDTSDPWDDRIDPGAPTASPQDYENMVPARRSTGTWATSRSPTSPATSTSTGRPTTGSRTSRRCSPRITTRSRTNCASRATRDSRAAVARRPVPYQVTNDGDFIRSAASRWRRSRTTGSKAMPRSARRGTRSPTRCAWSRAGALAGTSAKARA